MQKSTFSSDYPKLLSLLREVRSEAGLRQIDLAKRLRCHQSFVSKYESGERRLDLIELKWICEAIGVPLVELVERFEKLATRKKRPRKKTSR